MILLDLSQVMISNLMMQIAINGEAISEGLVRHMTLNSIKSYVNKFGPKYGELVVCCDSRNVWRKNLFPHYKANRKKVRENSPHNWVQIFGIINTIIEELSQYMPYKVVRVDSAEADDIIAVLCHSFGSYTKNDKENILILSGDKDFAQLQKYKNVTQYSPVQKTYILTDNPAKFLQEHILLGDRGDGIPNFLSDDDTFVANKRQTPISRKKLEEWSRLDPKAYCDERMMRGYKRNEALINHDTIPINIKKEILYKYDTQIPNGRSKIMGYFMDKRLRALMEHISEF